MEIADRIRLLRLGSTICLVLALIALGVLCWQVLALSSQPHDRDRLAERNLELAARVATLEGELASRDERQALADGELTELRQLYDTSVDKHNALKAIAGKLMERLKRHKVPYEDLLPPPEP